MEGWLFKQESVARVFKFYSILSLFFYKTKLFILPVDFRFYIRHRVGCVLSQKECEVQSGPAVHWLSSHQQQTVELVRDQLGYHLKQKLCFPVYHTQKEKRIYLNIQTLHNIKCKYQVQMLKKENVLIYVTIISLCRELKVSETAAQWEYYHWQMDWLFRNKSSNI